MLVFNSSLLKRDYTGMNVSEVLVGDRVYMHCPCNSLSNITLRLFTWLPKGMFHPFSVR